MALQQLTQEQVRLLCIDVGFSKPNARIASAIAMVEAPAYTDPPRSDFDLVGDQELANEKWGFSYGGFQVRSLRAEFGTGSYRDAERLIRKRFNCWAAKKIRASQGWRAWTTYRTGQYKAYMQEEFPPEPGTYVVVAGDTIGGIAQAVNTSWEELARINGLHSPYKIYPGDVLLLP